MVCFAFTTLALFSVSALAGQGGNNNAAAQQQAALAQQQKAGAGAGLGGQGGGLGAGQCKKGGNGNGKKQKQANANGNNGQGGAAGAGDSKFGGRQANQFITGPCASKADCASGCCTQRNGKVECAAPGALGVQDKENDLKCNATA